MKCFFLGHKFGKVENGHQYCERCGIATVPIVQPAPHPCASGHIWEEVSRLGWEGTYFRGGGSTEWRDWKIAYRCKNCGETKTEWLFGH
jgi:hypothetical protein